jgi:hypothetical protein
LGAALCVALLPAGRALAQAGGAILGTITDAQSLALPGVELTLRNAESGLTRATVSEANGTYRFSGVPPGTYDLKAVLDGFGVSELKGQTVTVGLEVKHDFVMRIQALQETLTVTAQVPVIEATKSEVSGVVTQQQIENVPVPTRQTLDLALLLPGTNTDGSVPRRVSVSVGAGGAVSQNAFLVDGVSNSQSTGGDPRQDFPQGGIREFRVNVSQASAEFGGTTGGVVSIVTRSGTNRFSGDAFEFFRDKSLNAMNQFEQMNHDRCHAGRPDRDGQGALPRRDRRDADRSVDHRQHRQTPGLRVRRGRVSEQSVSADVFCSLGRANQSRADVLRPLGVGTRQPDVSELRRHRRLDVGKPGAAAAQFVCRGPRLRAVEPCPQ